MIIAAPMNYKYFVGNMTKVFTKIKQLVENCYFSENSDMSEIIQCETEMDNEKDNERERRK